MKKIAYYRLAGAFSKKGECGSDERVFYTKDVGEIQREIEQFVRMTGQKAVLCIVSENGKLLGRMPVGK